MSISLTPINDPEGESWLDMSNGTWETLTALAAPVVPAWTGLHDPITYTSEQLRAVAAVVPAAGEWRPFHDTLKNGLLRLADAGGAELS